MISTQKNYTHPRHVALHTQATALTDLLVAPQDTVKIGQPLEKNVDDPVYSTISGTVTEIRKMTNVRNHASLAVLIENDFKDKTISTLKQTDVETLLKKYFNAPLAMEHFLFEANHTCIIDLIPPNEPFIAYDAKHHAITVDKTMETVQRLHKLWPFAKVVFITSNENDKLLTSADIPLEIIKVKPDKTPEYRYKYINKYFNDALLHQQAYQYLTIDGLLRMHEMFTTKHPPVTTRLILSGEGFKTPMIMQVRIGTLFTELASIAGLKKKKLSLNINRLLESNYVTHNSFSIDFNTVSLSARDYREHESYPCIACGRCNVYCPVGILPSKIMHTKEHNIVLEHMRSDLCIDCGLCSYVCPSKIHVMRFVQAAKNELGGDLK